MMNLIEPVGDTLATGEGWLLTQQRDARVRLTLVDGLFEAPPWTLLGLIVDLPVMVQATVATALGHAFTAGDGLLYAVEDLQRHHRDAGDAWTASDSDHHRQRMTQCWDALTDEDRTAFSWLDPVNVLANPLAPVVAEPPLVEVLPEIALPPVAPVEPEMEPPADVMASGEIVDAVDNIDHEDTVCSQCGWRGPGFHACESTDVVLIDDDGNDVVDAVDDEGISDPTD